MKPRNAFWTENAAEFMNFFFNAAAAFNAWFSADLRLMHFMRMHDAARKR